MSDSPVVFKRKKGSAARSNLSRTAAQDDAADDAAGNVAVVRKKTAANSVAARDKKVSRLSFGADESNESTASTNDKPKRSLKRSEFTAAPTAAPLRLPDTETEKPQVYSASYLSELRASTQSRPAKAPSIEPMDVDVETNGAAEMAIPTSNAIAAAKMKRDLARKKGNGPELDEEEGFISLDAAEKPSKYGESRIVRDEEDELGEGDEDLAAYTGSNERIPLGKRATEQREREVRAGIIDAINDAANEDEDDEEVKEWEAAQARRGDAQQAREDRTSTGAAPYKPAPIPQTRPPPSLAAAKTRLATALSELQVSHKQDAETLSGIAKQRVDIDREEAELRIEVSRMSEQYGWFDDFNSWLKDIVAFLDVKYPQLEKIEQDNLSHQRERLAMITRRRQAQDSDDLAAFTGLAVPVADEEEDALKPHSAARRARRAARPAADDGYTTSDGLSAAEEADLTSAIAQLVDALSKLFADVQSDDFRDPDVGVRPRFVDWRARFPDSYAASYAGLAMVNVWEFWARTEMALWNPFGVPELPPSPLSLDGYQWHQSLTSFAHTEQAEPSENDDLVSNMVGTVILGRLLPFAKEVYDPYSSRATGRALSIVEEITYCVDRNSRKFEGLIQAFMTSIVAAVQRAQQLIQPHLGGVVSPVHALDTDSFIARDRFAARQVKLVIQALRWRRYARMSPLPGAQTPLEPFIANELVAKVLLPVLEAGAKPSYAAQVLAVFPPGSALPAQLADQLKAVSS